ncbi:MAG: Uncharacterised protein [Cryomorphaceae bacterium]|jgi:hypothetical protein|nr:MAG: Uncharacterised protein [Cryomorphaceae bacterium]
MYFLLNVQLIYVIIYFNIQLYSTLFNFIQRYLTLERKNKYEKFTYYSFRIKHNVWMQ